MLNKSPKSTIKKKRLFDKFTFLNKIFGKNSPENTAQNYNEMVSKFHQKIKKS
jgi:hypothetical protein